GCCWQGVTLVLDRRDYTCRAMTEECGRPGPEIQDLAAIAQLHGRAVAADRVRVATGHLLQSGSAAGQVVSRGSEDIDRPDVSAHSTGRVSMLPSKLPQRCVRS